MGQDVGVIGSVHLLNKRKVAEQPIVSLEWNTTKLGLGVMCALDQTAKVVMVTKLNNY